MPVRILLLIAVLVSPLIGETKSVSVHTIDDKTWAELEAARKKVADLEESVKRKAGWRPAPSILSTTLEGRCLETFTEYRLEGRYILVIEKEVPTGQCRDSITELEIRPFSLDPDGMLLFNAEIAK